VGLFQDLRKSKVWSGHGLHRQASAAHLCMPFSSKTGVKIDPCSVFPYLRRWWEKQVENSTCEFCKVRSMACNLILFKILSYLMSWFRTSTIAAVLSKEVAHLRKAASHIVHLSCIIAGLQFQSFWNILPQHDKGNSAVFKALHYWKTKQPWKSISSHCIKIESRHHSLNLWLRMEYPLCVNYNISGATVT